MVRRSCLRRSIKNSRTPPQPRYTPKSTNHPYLTIPRQKARLRNKQQHQKQGRLRHQIRKARNHRHRRRSLRLLLLRRNLHLPDPATPHRQKNRLSRLRIRHRSRTGVRRNPDPRRHRSCVSKRRRPCYGPTTPRARRRIG